MGVALQEVATAHSSAVPNDSFLLNTLKTVLGYPEYFDELLSTRF